MNLNGLKQRHLEGIDGISCQNIQVMTYGATATRMRKIHTIKLHKYGHLDGF